MNKQITVSFYDACLPDYFGGHNKPVLQEPVDGNTTRKELYDGLLWALSQGVIDYEIDNNQLDCDAIRQAIKNCIYFKPECKDNDILFPNLELWTDNGNFNFCYAFFVVDWEEPENE